MLQVKIIAVGNIREQYYKDACEEYIKRLCGFCRPELCELKEHKLPDKPSDGEIAAALHEEGERILQAIPPKSLRVVLAVEGKMLSSEELSALIDRGTLTHSSLCFIIGSSYGLSPEVKACADVRLSFSRLTFPHRLFRVMLLEAVYRAFTISKGTGYHK